MDWLIIIFIIYGIVSKLMGGSKEKNGRQRPGQRTPQRPGQTQVPSPRQAPEPWTTQYPKQTKRPTFDPFDPFDPFSTKDREEREPWPTFPPKQKEEDVLKETHVQSTVGLSEKNTNYSEQVESKNKTERKMINDVEKSNVQINPSTQALVQGIIWSEILGPPRSKKARRSVNYRIKI